MGRAGVALTIAVCGLLLCPPTAAQVFTSPDPEWPAPGAPPVARDPWLVKRAVDSVPGTPSSFWIVEPDFDSLYANDNDRFRLMLADQSIVTLVRERQESRANGLVWIGQIEGEPSSNVVLSAAGDAL